MSQFLPETSGGSEFKVPGGPVSDADLQFVSRAFGNPNLIAQVAPQFLSYLVSYIEQSGLLIPASQVPGFNQFTPNAADTIETQESTASTSYTDLSTVGPTKTDVPAGKYLFLYGGWVSVPPSATAWMSLSINGAAASDNDAVIGSNANAASVAFSTSRVVAATLTNDANTVTVKYRVNTGTADFRSRWLIALRYANL